MTVTPIARAADLSTEELHAIVLHLLQRTADLEAKLRRAHTDLAVADGLNQEREWENDQLKLQLHREKKQKHDLAVHSEQLQQNLDRAQQRANEPKPARTSWLSGRIGNSL
ncbi:MAG: hypothetical protein HOY79_17490 [Streptomyces sp.]|nr:hypothetical protein [Streptomyces sp.]